MARFSLNRSQRAKLANAIKRFNVTMESLGVSSYRVDKYETLRDSIHSKKQFEQTVNRLNRLQRPSQQIIKKSFYGTEYLQWEQQELNRITRAANRERKKMRENLKSERALGFIPTDEEVYYRDRRYNLNGARNRSEIVNWMNLEQKVRQGLYQKEKEETFRENMIASLKHWPDIPAIAALKELFKTADIKDLRIVHADPRFDTSLQNNYALYYTLSEEDLIEGAENLYQRWKVNLEFMAEERRRKEK